MEKAIIAGVSLFICIIAAVAYVRGIYYREFLKRRVLQPAREDSVCIRQHINLLGLRVEDKVTGFQGVVASVSFDLYGCVQAIVNPGADKDGKLKEQCWFDVSRLKVLEPVPVMDLPNFYFGLQAEGKQGAAEKPQFQKA